MVNEYSFKYTSPRLFWTSLTIFPYLKQEGLYWRRHTSTLTSRHMWWAPPICQCIYKKKTQTVGNYRRCRKFVVTRFFKLLFTGVSGNTFLCVMLCWGGIFVYGCVYVCVKVLIICGVFPRAIPHSSEPSLPAALLTGRPKKRNQQSTTCTSPLLLPCHTLHGELSCYYNYTLLLFFYYFFYFINLSFF